MKAFDTVPNRRLFYKLQYYGINCKIWVWIQYLLMGRSQTFQGHWTLFLMVTSDKWYPLGLRTGATTTCHLHK